MRTGVRRIVALGALALLAGCGAPERAAPPAATPAPDEVRAVYERALASRPAAPGPGQVVHTVAREYERHLPDRADPACSPQEATSPETRATESWAALDGRGRVARRVTYTRDGAGRLVSVAVADREGAVTWYPGRGVDRWPQAGGDLGPAGDFDERAYVLSLLPDLGDRPARALRDETVEGRPAVAVEYRYPVDDEGRAFYAQVAALQGLAVRETGQRFLFDRESGALAGEVRFVVTDRDREVVERAATWLLVEALDPARVPPGALDPAIPDLPPVPAVPPPPDCTTPATPDGRATATVAPFPTAPAPTRPAQSPPGPPPPPPTPDPTAGAAGTVFDFFHAVLGGYPKKARTYLAPEYAAVVGDLEGTLGLAGRPRLVSHSYPARAGGPDDRPTYALACQLGDRAGTIAFTLERRGDEWRIVDIVPFR